MLGVGLFMGAGVFYVADLFVSDTGALPGWTPAAAAGAWCLLTLLSAVKLAVTRETLVWAEGMAEWTAAGDVDAVAKMFGASSPQTPAPLRERLNAPPHVYSNSRSGSIG